MGFSCLCRWISTLPTTLKSSLPKHYPKIQHYRDLSKFTEEAFCQDLLAASFNLCEYQQDGNQAFNRFQDILSSIVNKHAPIKSKIVPANNKPLAKIHRKAIMLRKKLKNIYNKYRTKDNFQKYKEQRNHCANLRQRVKSNYFTKICQEGMLDSKTFWKKLKPHFFTKGQGDSAITISENDCLISDPQSVAEILMLRHTHFVSIGQITNSIYKGLTENSTITEIIRYFKSIQA